MKSNIIFSNNIFITLLLTGSLLSMQQRNWDAEIDSATSAHDALALKRLYRAVAGTVGLPNQSALLAKIKQALQDPPPSQQTSKPIEQTHQPAAITPPTTEQFAPPPPPPPQQYVPHPDLPPLPPGLQPPPLPQAKQNQQSAAKQAQRKKNIKKVAKKPAASGRPLPKLPDFTPPPPPPPPPDFAPTPPPPSTTIQSPTEQHQQPQNLLESIRQGKKLKPVDANQSTPQKVAEPSHQDTIAQALQKRREAMSGKVKKDKGKTILPALPPPSLPELSVDTTTEQTGDTTVTPPPPPPPSTPVFKEPSTPSRGALLDQIKAGTTLKKAAKQASEGPSKPTTSSNEPAGFNLDLIKKAQQQDTSNTPTSDDSDWD